MRHLPNVVQSPVERADLERIGRGADDGALDAIKAYLDLRSRGIEPPTPLVEAWDQFYAFHAPRIRSFLKGWKLPEADRSDCFQEVWKDIVGKLAHFHHDSGRGRFSTWLMTLARNKVVDSVRRRNRHVSERLGDSEVSSPMDPGPGPAVEYERRRTRAQVQSALAELAGQVSWTSFQVLYLRWIEGWETAEVAAALELTPQQVRFRSHRMKQKVRRLLERSMDRDNTDENPIGPDRPRAG
jgi:RNA polymerase sigma-70 factor (ECF subfamily)